MLFDVAGSKRRHNHVWLSFGPVLEHVFFSPAQPHHSLAPRHHHRNYGEVLAVWDWMFGTLHVPQGGEDIEYGLADRKGNRLRPRHDSLRAAMTVPATASWRQICKRLGRPVAASAREPVHAARRPPEGEGAPDASLTVSARA